MQHIIDRDQHEVGYLDGTFIRGTDASGSILGSIEEDRVLTWLRIPVGWRRGRFLVDYAGRLVAAIVCDDGAGIDLSELAAASWSWIGWDRYLPTPHGDGAL
jgi:hypothetical protein